MAQFLYYQSALKLIAFKLGFTQIWLGYNVLAIEMKQQRLIRSRPISKLASPMFTRYTRTTSKGVQEKHHEKAASRQNR